MPFDAYAAMRIYLLSLNRKMSACRRWAASESKCFHSETNVVRHQGSVRPQIMQMQHGLRRHQKCAEQMGLDPRLAQASSDYSVWWMSSR